MNNEMDNMDRLMEEKAKLLKEVEKLDKTRAKLKKRLGRKLDVHMKEQEKMEILMFILNSKA